jgi:hypothetical protein
MASAAQVLANRANALKSTGPRTLEGKVRSAQNSRTHGFTAATLFIPDDERAEFEAFSRELIRDTRPEGALEHEFFGRLLTSAWNLRRVRLAESRLLASSELDSDDQAALRLERLARYRRGLERAHDCALAELRNLQTQRAVLLQQDDSVIAVVYEHTPLAQLSRLTRNTDPYIAGLRARVPNSAAEATFAATRLTAKRRFYNELRRSVVVGHDEPDSAAAESASELADAALERLKVAA